MFNFLLWWWIRFWLMFIPLFTTQFILWRSLSPWVYLVHTLTCSSITNSTHVIIIIYLEALISYLFLLLSHGVYYRYVVVFGHVNIIIVRGTSYFFFNFIRKVRAGLLLNFNSFRGSNFLLFPVRSPWRYRSLTALATATRTRNCCIWSLFDNQNFLRCSSWLNRHRTALYLSRLHLRLLLAHHELHHVILVYPFLR